MKKVIMPLLAIVAILTTVGLFSVNSADAASCGCGCNGQGVNNGLKMGRLGMVEHKAQILGLTVEQLKERLGNGESMFDILQSKGLTREQYREQLRARIMDLKNEIRPNTNCSCGNLGGTRCGWNKNK